jgi:hypothetical protein
MGLFGPDPAQVQELLRQQEQKNSMEAVQGNPAQMTAFLGRRAGDSIGNALKTITGYEDPAVSRAKKMQEAAQEVMSSGINFAENPAGYLQNASIALAKRGFYNEALQSMVKSQGYAAEGRKEGRETRKLDLTESYQDKMMAYRDKELAVRERIASARIAAAKANAQARQAVASNKLPRGSIPPLSLAVKTIKEDLSKLFPDKAGPDFGRETMIEALANDVYRNAQKLMDESRTQGAERGGKIMSFQEAVGLVYKGVQNKVKVDDNFLWRSYEFTPEDLGWEDITDEGAVEDTGEEWDLDLDED